VSAAAASFLLTSHLLLTCGLLVLTICFEYVIIGFLDGFWWLMLNTVPAEQVNLGQAMIRKDTIKKAKR
jgi:hypothetical protein